MSTEAADGPSDKDAESEEPQEKVRAQVAPKIEEEEQDLKVRIYADVRYIPSCGRDGSRSWGPEGDSGASSPCGRAAVQDQASISVASCPVSSRSQQQRL